MAVLPELHLIRPTDLAGVLDVIDEDTVVYAGGTELIPALRLGVRRPSTIVDLKRVEAFRALRADEALRTMTIGAAMTHAEISSHAIVRRHLPTLAEATSHVGNARVRSAGTIGGNLCFAEPRSDISCVLTALAATATVRSVRAERVLSMGDLLLGPFETSLAPDELLIEVTVPFEPRGMTYWKLQSYERPTVGVAVIVTEDEWQITVGAAVDIPVRAVVPAGDTVAVAAFVQTLEIGDDLSGSASYKRYALENYLASRLGGEPA